METWGTHGTVRRAPIVNGEIKISWVPRLRLKQPSRVAPPPSHVTHRIQRSFSQRPARYAPSARRSPGGSRGTAGRPEPVLGAGCWAQCYYLPAGGPPGHRHTPRPAHTTPDAECNPVRCKRRALCSVLHCEGTLVSGRSSSTTGKAILAARSHQSRNDRFCQSSPFAQSRRSKTSGRGRGGQHTHPASASSPLARFQNRHVHRAVGGVTPLLSSALEGLKKKKERQFRYAREPKKDTCLPMLSNAGTLSHASPAC